MRIFFVLVFAVALAGCATNNLSEQQLRSFEEKVFEGSYDSAFKSTLQVFQDKGFVVDNADFASGTIKATSIKEQVKFSTATTNKIASITLERFGENRVKMRMTIVNQLTAGAGFSFVQQGRMTDPTYIQGIYNSIQKEMFIRENLSH